MDEQRPAGWDAEPSAPVDRDADGPPPPPPQPAGAPPPVSPAPVSPAPVSPAPVSPPAASSTSGSPSVPQPAQTGARRRSRWPLLVVLVAVLVAVPLALLVLAGPGGDEGSTAALDGEQDGDTGSSEGSEGGGDDLLEDGDGADEDPDAPGGDGDAPGGDGDAPGGDGDAPGGIEPDAELEPLDLTALAGLDRTYGQLLTDIDASERAMIAFQAGLAEAFGGAGSPQDALDGAGEVAAESRERLLAVRDRLTAPLDDAGADRVRERYVDHLDAWEGFMAEVEADPLAALEQGERGSTVRINASADAFARALEAELPGDIAAEVARYADELLDRGFRDMGYADV